MSDFDLVAQAGYTGLPFACHLTVGAGPTARFGFPSPSGAALRRGDPLACNISYWGSNICRAGWIAGSERDLPAGAAGYVEEFVAPYFETMAEWLALLRPGVRGGDIYELVQSRLPFERFGIFLNPGHLIHYDEWLSAPVYEGSEVRLRSGMVFQIDVIPSSARWFSTRMEDGVAIADADLRRELQRRFPPAYDRCLARREFMRALPRTAGARRGAAAIGHVRHHPSVPARPRADHDAQVSPGRCAMYPFRGPLTSGRKHG